MNGSSIHYYNSEYIVEVQFSCNRFSHESKFSVNDNNIAII